MVLDIDYYEQAKVEIKDSFMRGGHLAQVAWSPNPEQQAYVAGVLYLNNRPPDNKFASYGSRMTIGNKRIIPQWQDMVLPVKQIVKYSLLNKNQEYKVYIYQEIIQLPGMVLV